MQLRHFPSPIDQLLGRPIFYLAYRDQAPARLPVFLKFIYSHAAPEDVPRIMQYLSQLWNTILSSGTHLEQRLNDIAQLEWIFYRTNPFGRGAATTGRVLSLLLQKHIANTHAGFQIEQHFDRYDQLALDLDFSDYLTIRWKRTPLHLSGSP